MFVHAAHLICIGICFVMLETCLKFMVQALYNHSTRHTTSRTQRIFKEFQRNLRKETFWPYSKQFKLLQLGQSVSTSPTRKMRHRLRVVPLPRLGGGPPAEGGGGGPPASTSEEGEAEAPLAATAGGEVTTKTRAAQGFWR